MRLVEERLGINTARQSVQQQAIRLRVTRAQVDARSGTCGDGPSLRWPDGETRTGRRHQKLSTFPKAKALITQLSGLTGLIYPSLEYRTATINVCDVAVPRFADPLATAKRRAVDRPCGATNACRGGRHRRALDIVEPPMVSPMVANLTYGEETPRKRSDDARMRQGAKNSPSTPRVLREDLRRPDAAPRQNNRSARETLAEAAREQRFASRP